MGIKKKHVPGCSCCGAAGECGCATLPSSLLLTISGLGENATCCSELNASFVLTPSNELCDPDNPCVFEHPNVQNPAFCSGSDFFMYICVTLAASGGSVAVSGTLTVYRGSPFFDTPMTITFSGTLSSSCTGWCDEALTIDTYSASSPLACTQSSLAMVISSDTPDGCA